MLSSPRLSPLRRRRYGAVALIALSALGGATIAPSARADKSAGNVPQIKFTQYTLPNGLRVILVARQPQGRAAGHRCERDIQCRLAQRATGA